MNNREESDASIVSRSSHSLQLITRNDEVYFRVVCSSDEEVLLSSVNQGFIRALHDDLVSVRSLQHGGTLYVDCPEHGRYLGLWQLIESGPEDESGSTPVIMPLLLIPLNNVETVLTPISRSQLYPSLPRANTRL